MTHPAHARVMLGHDAGGLLDTLASSPGATMAFTYDAAGMLVFEELPDGGSRSFVRTEFAGGRTVELTSAEGTRASYRVERQAGSRTRRLITHTDGTTTELFENADGSRSRTTPDGTSRTWRLRPDPRFGMAAPLMQNLVETTPGGLASTASETRTVTLANAADPLSLLTLAETTVVNGRTYRRDYTASTRRSLLRSPANRQTTLGLDAQGRLVTSRYDNLNAVTMGHDANGDLTAPRPPGRDPHAFARGATQLLTRIPRLC